MASDNVSIEQPEGTEPIMILDPEQEELGKKQQSCLFGIQLELILIAHLRLESRPCGQN